MRKGLGVLIALLIAGASGSGVYYQFVYRAGAEANGGRISSTSEDAVPVESVSELAGLDSASGTAERFAGVIEAQETWSAKLESDKTVKETYVEEGDMVKVGDRLFAYDTSSEEDKLAQDQIDLERLENDISGARANIEQINREKAADTNADNQLSYQTRLLQEENSIKQSEYDIKTKKLEIQQYQESIAAAVVTSRLAGVVRTVNDSTGSSANSDSGSDTYITIMAVGDYRVKGTVNEQNFNSIYEGMRVIVFSRVDDSTWNGTVSRIATDAGTSSNSNDDYSSSGSGSDTSSTNYPFYVELDDSSSLMLGQHVYMEEDLGQTASRSGLWLPEYYFNDIEGDSAWVWAASSSNVLEKRVVTLGGYDDSTMEYQVTSGLDGDDYIRTDDSEITQGLPVTYLDYTSDDSIDSSDGVITYDNSSDDVITYDDSSDDGTISDDGSVNDDGTDDGNADGVYSDDTLSADGTTD